MKVVGIIAEYNPFHNGHAYQIEQVKKQHQPDVLIVVMSGNIVQRGEFALLDKWQRANIALEHGVDLVIELPLLASLQSADYFAQVSINLLARLKCQTVVFGTETAKSDELFLFSDWLTDYKDEIDQQIRKYLSKGHSYAYAYQESIDELKAPLTFNSSSSNHILALQYIRWNEQLDDPMTLIALPRIQHQQGNKILSGTQVRQRWYNGQLTKGQVPYATWQALNNHPTVQWSNYWPLLQYRLVSDSYRQLEEMVGAKEGIERKFKHVATKASFEDFIDTLTSKRWSRSSLQRLSMAILLNLTKKRWHSEKQQNEDHFTVRVLGFNEQGRAYLKHLKDEPTVTLFTNLTQSLERDYELTLQADRVYQLNRKVKVNEQITGKYAIYRK